MGSLCVMSAEGPIGIKLQALANHPARMRDLGDIRALLRAQSWATHHDRGAGHFALFDRGRCWMNCSPKSPTARSEAVREPLVGGDVPNVVQAAKGDLSDWVEWMEAVEALCPVWPTAERPPVREWRVKL